MSETDSLFPSTSASGNRGIEESYKLEERKMASPKSPENLQEPLFPRGEADVSLEVRDPRRMRERDFSARASVWHQFRALFLKDLTLQSRAIGTNLCQLLTPIIFICFAGIMQVIVNHILNSHQVPIPGSDAYLIPVDAGRVIACLPENNSYSNPAVCRDEFLNFFDEFDWEFYLNSSSSSDLADLVQLVKNLSILSIIPQQQILFDLPFYYVGKAEDVDLPLGNLSFNGTRNGFLGKMVPGEWYYNFSTSFVVDPDWPLNRSFPDNYTNDEGPYLNIPFFLEIEDRSTLNQRLVDVIKDYNNLAHSSSGGDDQYDRTYVVTPLSQDQYLEVLWDVRNGTQEQNETSFYITPQDARKCIHVITHQDARKCIHVNK